LEHQDRQVPEELGKFRIALELVTAGIADVCLRLLLEVARRQLD
jgi:hypothetical protein